MTTDLATWLLWQVDADEQCATAAGHGFGHLPLLTELNGTWTELDLTQNVRPTYDQRFAKVFAPARVLAECAAKRQLVEIAVAQLEAADLYPGGQWAGSNARAAGILQVLALPYADRSGYREEWRM